ncbi:MAG: hypothetical protein WC703_02125 [Candidatus Neomarinimicrobiota bacterium]
MKSSSILLKFIICLVIVLCYSCQHHPGNQNGKKTFNFSKYIFGQAPSLYVYVKSVDKSTGGVLIRGGDSRKPPAPFILKWGDGAVTEGNFPQEHVYPDRTQNYIITVKARYSDSSSDSAEAFIRFVAPEIIQKALPSNIAVSIPDSMVMLESRMPKEELYEFSDSLTYFEDKFFPVIPRKTIEYILSVAASIQMKFVNNDVYKVNGGFNQVMLRHGQFGGMYSLWYTNPVSFGVGDYGFRGTIQWSSFFHEMGHNFTLNSPAGYYYGGKSDGNSSTIFSETMAQIFQHVTAYYIVNNYKDYGLSEDLAYEIQLSAQSSFSWPSSSYKRYINSGKNFASWDDPNTPQDETFDTFMTIAYKFFEHAEKGKPDYENQLKRMMKFLQQFNEDWHRRYDPKNDSVEGATFRATLMVSALSYAFDEDLRVEFRELDFPISDEIYLELMIGN